MTQEKLIDAITDLDSDILNRYFDMKADLAAKKKPKKRTWVKWASLAAACFVLVIAATFITQYIPTEYNLNYSYVDANGRETYIADKNVWIYYVDSGDIERERVKLPCTAENVFITWKHLNTIGDEVELIECKIVSNGNESTSEFEGQGVANYEPGDYFVLNITVTKNLQFYEDYELLIDSLEKSMSEYSNIDFDEIKVLFN